MDDQNNKNLLLATVLSFLVVLVWFFLFPPEDPALTAPPAEVVDATTPATPPAAEQAPAASEGATVSAVATAPRLTIDTPRLSGSISMVGGRIDDLVLKDAKYRETLDPASPQVRLLTPVGQDNAYYALHGWAPGGSLDFADVPGATTEWQIAGGSTLSTDNPVTLRWQSPKGLVFTRTIAVDGDFMFTITDKVENTGTAEARLQPYGIVARHGTPPDLQNFFVLHEGVVGRTDGTLTELKYDDIAELPANDRERALAEVTEATTDGWIGFTDKYWMTVLIPEQGTPFTSVTKFTPAAQGDTTMGVFQTEVRKPVVSIAPGGSVENSSRLFAGAKEWETIRTYEREANVPGFIDSIDWGWFFFLTKPIFALLHWLNGAIGNMGLAIIALTFVLKLLVLPLAYKSYVSMAKMKELQPEMEALKERAGEDKQKLQREMMQLYKDKKVNPAAGCLPILIQIPIFFALYKVIFVTIELRHAPFFGWLTDLSAPDPSSLYNLFGLLPWAAPAPGSLLALIFIGVTPILLGISMWLQQKLNPAPTDPVQQQVFAWMPWVFMFMLGGFASGLVVYWITNNLITFAQQYAIMRSHGHKPDIFGNIKSGFKKKPAAAAANTPTAPKGKAKK